jgi:serine/threonine-protein kinase
VIQLKGIAFGSSSFFTLAMGLPLPDGTIVQNRYQILRVLGQGGFGRTYLAQDTNRFNELCVLKEFDPQTQGAKHAQKAEELFSREAGVLYRLQHPQIPQFRELFRVKTQNRELLFLVQDYVAGQTYYQQLEDRLQKGRTFNESEVMQLLQEILPVLDYIHRSGIVHRDISPDNIILRHTDQKPVLIDFGVVKAAATQAVSSQYSSQTFVGKPGYAPVEQLQKGNAEPSSDLYALAVTIAVLLTGREAQSLFDPMTLNCEWKRYTSVSPLFAQVLDRMMSNRPSDRYASAQDVLRALSAIGSVPTSQPDSSTALPVHSPPSRQATIAVGRRNRSVAVATRPGTYPRSWFEVAFDVPLALMKGVAKSTYWLVKGVFKMMFGIVRFSVFGVLKFVIRLVLWIAAIASVLWLIPQVFPYVANLTKMPAISLPSVSKPQTAQIPDYEAECQKLGIDYSKFIKDVNEEFYQRYPDRRGKPLSQDRSDEKLRNEWHRIAQEMLKQTAREIKTQNNLAEF